MPESCLRYLRLLLDTHVVVIVAAFRLLLLNAYCTNWFLFCSLLLLLLLLLIGRGFVFGRGLAFERVEEGGCLCTARLYSDVLPGP